MKKLLTALMLISATQACVADRNASESTILASSSKETRPLDKFRSISVANSIKVILHRGSTNQAVVEAPADIADRIMTEVNGDELKIGVKSRTRMKGSVTVIVTYTEELAEIQVSTSSSLKADHTINSRELHLKSTTSAMMQLTIEVEDLSLSASTSASIEVSGLAKDGKIKAQTSASIKGYDLTLGGKVAVSVSTSASIKLTITGEMDANATTSGSIYYKGSPSITGISENTSGNVQQR